jgi:hypothetical protein
VRLSDDDFHIVEVHYNGRDNGREGLDVVKLGGHIEDAGDLGEYDRLVTAGRSRLARNWIHGIGLSIDQVRYSGSQDTTELETTHFGTFSYAHGNGHSRFGPFSTVTDPLLAEDLDIEGDYVELPYVIADVRRLQGEEGSGVELCEGMEMARLGGFDIEDIALNGPTSPRRIRPGDPLKAFRLGGLRACYRAPEEHADPPECLIRDQYNDDELYDPAIEDPEFSEDGILPAVDGENPENQLVNSFTGDVVDFPTDRTLYEPVHTPGATAQDIEGMELSELQDPVDDFDPDRHYSRCLVKSRDPVTFDGFKSLLVKPQSDAGHLHSVWGDEWFDDPMLLEYIDAMHLPMNGRLMLVETEES